MGELTVESLFAALRSRWRIVLLSVVICVGAATAAVFTAVPLYRSRAQMFVATQGSSAADLQFLYQGGQFSQNQVQSYVGLVHSPLILGPVIARLGLHESQSALADTLTASAPMNTVLINVEATSSSPRQAQRVAAAVAAQFITLVSQLERTATNRQAAVTMKVSYPANLPTSPISPRKKLTIIVALLVGLLLGSALALLRHRLDTRLRSPEELPAMLGVTLLAVIPTDPAFSASGASPLLSDADPRRSEALRFLRTNLQFVDLGYQPGCLVITSALAGEGKTTTALGLADAIATGGDTVIAVEGDLRLPTFMRTLGLEASGGLTEALLGETPVSDLLIPCGDSGRLRVLTSGRIPPNPNELVASTRMAELVGELQDLCDVLIIDAPPLLPVSDAAVLATLSTGVVLVAQPGRVRRTEVARALESVRRVNVRVLGAVANNVRASGRGDYGYSKDYIYAKSTVA